MPAKAITLKTGTISATGSATANNSADGRSWCAYLKVGGVTGTNPTLTVTFEHSADGTNWVTLIAMTQATAAGVEHKFAAAATDYLKPLLPYLRVSYTLGGTGGPTFTGVEMKLFVDRDT